MKVCLLMVQSLGFCLGLKAKKNFETKNKVKFIVPKVVVQTKRQWFGVGNFVLDPVGIPHKILNGFPRKNIITSSHCIECPIV